jgi:hypothetical protein
MRNRRGELLIFGFACLAVAACSGTDTSALTAPVQGTAGGAAGASGSAQGGAAGTLGYGGSAPTAGSGGATGAGGVFAPGGSAGAAGTGLAGGVGAGGVAGVAGGGGVGGVVGSGGVAGSAGGGGAGGVGGTAGAGGVGGTAGTGGAGGESGTGGVAGAGGTGGTGGIAGAGGEPGTGGSSCAPACTQRAGCPDPVCWTATANPNNQAASLAIDGKEGTRYATNAPASGDEWLQVDLCQAEVVTGVNVFTSGGTDEAPSYNVQVSTDGAAWQTVLTSTTPAQQRMALTFDPVTARYIRMNQTGKMGFWWGINEMSIVCQ